MAFKKLKNINGEIFIPNKQKEKKHNCEDCFNCQFCSDTRCRNCLKHNNCKLIKSDKNKK